MNIGGRGANNKSNDPDICEKELDRVIPFLRRSKKSRFEIALDSNIEEGAF